MGRRFDGRRLRRFGLATKNFVKRNAPFFKGVVRKLASDAIYKETGYRLPLDGSLMKQYDEGGNKGPTTIKTSPHLLLI